MTTVEKVFDRKSIYWENNIGNNMYSVLLQKEFFNYMFKMKGYVFLKDICNNLGIRLEKEYQDMGWSKLKGNEYVAISFFAISETNDLKLVFECDTIV